MRAHASVHANNDIAVMVTNTNRNNPANVTLNFNGGMAACVGKRYAYTPVNTDQDGGLTGEWIFSNTGRNIGPGAGTARIRPSWSCSRGASGSGEARECAT